MTDTPKREPLLDSDRINFPQLNGWPNGAPMTAIEVRDHYENLIDTGVLMVVKTIRETE